MDDLELNIKIIGFSAEIKPVVRQDNIKAFVTWIFQTESGVIKVYGGTIRQKPFGEDSKLILSYDPPAIGRKFIKVIFIEDKELYKKLCRHTIDLYCQLTGEIRNNISGGEDVNMDEIPF